jgi:tetratricopeptide (TPR) repeat protein
LAQGQRAVDLDPLNPRTLALYARVLIDAGNYQSAIQDTEKALSIDPDHWFAMGILENLCAITGDYQRWFELWEQNPRLPYLDKLTIEKIFHEKGYLAAIEETIKQIEEVAKKNEEAAEKKHIPIAELAFTYLIVKNYDEALDWLEVGVENHRPGMFYISTNIYWDHLKNNPRYIELLKKMNLPLPAE